MPFTETLEALGSWELELAEETPEEIAAQVGYYGHLVLVDGPVDVEATGNGLLAGARYVGVCRAIGKPDTYTRSGSGLLYWLGDEDDKGHTLLSEITLTNATLAQVVAALLPPTVTVGTVYAQANPATRYTGKHVFQSRRKALAIALAPFGAELRVNGNFTVDVGTPAQLYDATLPLTSKPSPLIVRKATSSDLDLTAVGGKVETEGAVWDFSTGVRVMGQTIGTGDEPDTTFVIGTADAPSVPWKDPQGNAVKSIRLVNASTETEGSAPATAALNLNRFNRPTTAVKVTADEYDVSGAFGVGDATYVYDPDSGFVDAANQQLFQGQPIHPAVIRVSSLTSAIVEGMTVAWRTDTGVWLDLTRWVVWESAGSRDITIGDLPKSLSKPSDPIQDRVDAARGKPSTKVPKTPTGLTLATSSAINPKGVDTAVIEAAWSAVTQYVDNTTAAIARYEVQYRPALRAPLWQGAAISATTDVDLPAVGGLVYNVQVRAVSTGQVPSAWSSTESITAAADSTAPAAPSDPVVTPYLGILRVYWDGLTNVGGAMPADFNRVDVHVGTTSGFTAGPSTLLSSLSTAGYAHVVAPYGSARFVRLIAYDHNGNPSTPSATVSGTAVQAGDGDIATLSVGKLTAGVLSADVTIAGRFATALTGARREMNSVGFQGYDASNNLTINLDGVNNLLTGRFRTALTGRRIDMGGAGGTNTVQFIAPDGRITQIGGFTGGGGSEVIRLGIENPTAMNVSQFWNKIQIQDTTDSIFAWSAFNGITVGGDGSGSKGFFVRYASGRGTNLDPTIPEVDRIAISASNNQYIHPSAGSTEFLDRASGGSLTVRFSINPIDINSFIKAGGTYRVWEYVPTAVSRFSIGGGTTGEVTFQWPSTNSRLVIKSGNNDVSAGLFLINNLNFGGRFLYVYNFGQEAFEVTDWQNTYYVRMRASAFDVVSDRETKTGIADYAGDALAAIRSARARTWRPKQERKRLLPDGTTEPDVSKEPAAERLGFVADETPAHWRVKGSGGLEALDLMAVVTDTVGAVAKLADIVDELRRTAA